MKKFLKVQQEEGTSLVQVDYSIKDSFESRFAGINVIDGPSLSFGAWLYIFKQEILEPFKEQIQKILDEYNGFYRNARIEAREMFREAENPDWCKTAIRTAFECVDNEAGIEYRFISKFYTDPMFDVGSVKIETCKVSPYWNDYTVEKMPKHIYVICALWKKFDWNQFIEPISYKEFEPKEYEFEEIPALSVEDILSH